MTFEYQHACLPLDQDLQQKLEVLAREGWALVPGTVPVGLYFLQRQEQTAQAMELTMGLDDTKIHIIRGNGGT